MALKNLNPTTTSRLSTVAVGLWLLLAVVFGGSGAAGCNEERFEGRGGCETDADCLAPRQCVDSWCVGTVVPDGGVDAQGDVPGDPGQDPSLDPIGDPSLDPSLDPIGDPRPEVSPTNCLQVDPNPLVFPAHTLGSSSTALLRLTNCGQELVVVDDLVLDVSPGAQFSLSPPPPLPILLEPGESFGLLMTARGNRVGDWNALLIVSSSASFEPLGVSLRVRVVDEAPVAQPCLEVQPVVDFGVLPANLSIANTFEVFNCGNVVLRIEDIEVPDPFVLDAVPDSLLPGQRSTLRAVVIPQPPGSYQAEVTVRASEGLVGTSIFFVRFSDDPPPNSCVEVVPPVLDLGAVAVGETFEGSFEVRNCGETALAFERPSFRGTPDGIRFVSGEERRVLPPGEVTRYVVSGVGSRPGNYAANWLVSEASGLVAPVGVVVRVRIVEEPVQPACLTIQPLLLDFGLVPFLGAVSQAVALRNCGSTPVRLAGVEVEGTGRFEVGIGPFVLGVGEGVPVPITFIADIEGLLVAESVARFFDEAGTVIAELQLRATVEDSTEGDCLSFGSAVLVLPAVQVGTLVSRPLNLVNCGTRDVVVQRLFGSASTLFQFVSSEPLPASLPPGGSLRITVRFRPPAVGEYRERLVAESSRGTVTTIQIVGTGRTVDAPCVEATPGEVDAGRVEVGDVTQVQVRLRNCGTTSWTWDRSNLVTDGAFLVGSTPEGQVITPGSVATATVVFSPTAIGRQQAILEVTTSPTAFVQVFVTGVGIIAARGPILEVRPSVLDFGDVPGGEVASGALSICNVGGEPLTLTTVELSGDSFFELGPLPTRELSAGLCQVLEVYFAPPAVPPGGASAFRAALRIVGEPVAGTADVLLLGNAFNDPPPPCPVFTPGVAREAAGPYAATLDVPRGASIFLDAGAPRGTVFEAFWTNSERPGSPVVLTGAGVPGRVTTTLNVDGNYTFVVEWRTPEGCSARQEVRVSVRGTGVGEGLRLVITWSTPDDPDEFSDPGSDVDLHLARRGPGGVWGWNSQNDCYYANRTPSWSSPGTQDDPRLLRDELNGLGPEILVLEQPSEDAYAVAVHYFSDAGLGESLVTLRVFWDGLQIDSASRVLRRSGEVWIPGVVRDNGRRFQQLGLANFGGFPATFPF